MLDFSVSIVPLVCVAIANFVLSWIYYSPMVPWFKIWQKGIGMDPGKTQMSEEDKKMLPVLFGGAIVGTFLLPYGLQILVHSLKITDFGTGAVLGFGIWIAFVLTHSLNTLFEGRKPSVLTINNVFYVITYAVYTGVLAVWR